MGQDNTVSFQNMTLQIEKMSWRGTLAGCTVTVHQHLDGTLSITHGPQRLGRYTSQGAPMMTRRRRQLLKRRSVEKSKSDFSTALGNPAKAAGFPLSNSCDGGQIINQTGHFTC